MADIATLGRVSKALASLSRRVEAHGERENQEGGRILQSIGGNDEGAA
jgi:hypothetical protein